MKLTKKISTRKVFYCVLLTMIFAVSVAPNIQYSDNSCSGDSLILDIPSDQAYYSAWQFASRTNITSAFGDGFNNSADSYINAVCFNSTHTSYAGYHNSGNTTYSWFGWRPHSNYATITFEQNLTIGDVQRAVEAILAVNPQLVLMQCNTNYTAADGNFDNIDLRVLKTYHKMWPDLILGLSDHTHGHATTLGAVALGARVVEKHFTDDNHREGPDHAFAMNPQSWADMVRNTRQLERALGSGNKRVTVNEQETVIVQRRCLRAARDIQAGEIIQRDMIAVLRPATPGAIEPFEIEQVIGTRASQNLRKGQDLRWTHLE